jgi:hypothetical protein
MQGQERSGEQRAGIPMASFPMETRSRRLQSCYLQPKRVHLAAFTRVHPFGLEIS